MPRRDKSINHGGRHSTKREFERSVGAKKDVALASEKHLKHPVDQVGGISGPGLPFSCQSDIPGLGDTPLNKHVEGMKIAWPFLC